MTAPQDTLPPTDDHPTHVVGIGASAGGLEALERLFRAMPIDTGMTFVVIQHLSPDFKSLMDELLERFTPMPVIPVADRARIEANKIYLLPPKKDMVIDGDELISSDRSPEKTLNLPINSFFRSLASSWGEHAIAIVLSGTGSDGSAGIMNIRECGGLVLSQNEESSRFDGMPRSAISTGSVDAIMAPEAMPAAIVAYGKNPQDKSSLTPHLAVEETEEGLPAIFNRLQSVYDIDFNFYKPQTISRRIERRITLNPEYLSIDDYSRRVLKDRNELDQLYKDLLIGVTRFFRDPEAFEVLRHQVIPNILDALAPDDEVRVWVCACSTGEEAYSIAILFLEAFEARGLPPRIKILATDLHRASLQTASEGLYGEDSLAEVPVDLREKYFNDLGKNTFKVSANLRKSLIFSEHNVLKDPPFTRMDLVTCRNLLIYFQSTAQLRAIASFHFALKVQGALLLGASEGLGELETEFKTLDRHWKVFQKTRDSRLAAELRSPQPFLPGRPPRRGSFGELRSNRLYDALLNRFIPAGILVNEHFEAVHVFGDASQFLRQPKGRITTDLMSMVDGNLRIALMTSLRNAAQKQASVSYRGISVISAEEHSTIDLVVDPLMDSQSSSTYYMVSLHIRPNTACMSDTAAILPEEVDEQTVAQIQHLEHELQMTRESLQSTVEELETSNEELQAANEELLASNEELQSTNEELHSVNEELYSVNAEHEQKIYELNNVSGDLDNLIRSTDLATLFIDRHYAIRLVTPKVEDIFPVLPQDIGRDLRHLQPKQPDPFLLPDLAAVMADGQAIERQVDMETRTYLRRVTPFRDVNKQLTGLVLTYVDISEQQALKINLGLSENKFRLIAENSGDWVFVIGPDERLQYVSPPCFEITGITADEFMQAPDLIKSIIHPEDLPAYHAHMAALDDCNGHRVDVRLLHRDGTTHWVEHNCRLIRDGNGTLLGRCGAIRDITERKKREMELRKLSLAVEQNPNSILITNLKGEIEYCNAAFVNTCGYERSEVIGKNSKILQSEETPAETYAELWQTITQGKTWEGEIINRKKSGERYIEHERIAPIVGPDGRINHYLATKEDITEQRRITDELERHRYHLEALIEQRTREIMQLNAQLDERAVAAEAANRAKSSFLANMSHEIRTPMNAITGLAYILRRQLSDPAQIERLDKISMAATHLLGVLNDILDISKIEANKMTLENLSFDLDATLSRVMAIIVDKAQAKGLELILDAEVPGRFIGDETRLSQGLLNYLSNAVKFTQTGTITLRAKMIERQAATVLIRFEVIDTGIGIPDENMARLFNIFEQGDNSTTREYGGTGLGLAITKRIANLMGGDAGAESSEGKGSTFWMTIRLDQANTGTGTQDHVVPPLSGKRALVVDDTAPTRLVHARLLSQAGLDCEVAASGDEALERLSQADQAGKPFDLLLIDMLMPEMNGLGLLTLVRMMRLSRQPLAWLVTGLGDPEMLKTARQGGFEEILSKPLSKTLLHDALTRHRHELTGGSNEVSALRPNMMQVDPVKFMLEQHPGIRVLLAEDDPINQEVARMLIEEIAWSADVANNGQEAVAMAQQNAYDLILMDMQMPIMGGVEATRILRAMPALKHIPIIAMTANAFAEDRDTCLEAGMDDFVTKPVEPKVLYEILHNRLKNRHDG